MISTVVRWNKLSAGPTDSRLDSPPVLSILKGLSLPAFVCGFVPKMASFSPSEMQYQLDHIQDNRAPAFIACYATCLALAFIAVLLRFIARRISRASVLADDWWILVSLVCHLHQLQQISQSQAPLTSCLSDHCNRRSYCGSLRYVSIDSPYFRIICSEIGLILIMDRCPPRTRKTCPSHQGSSCFRKGLWSLSKRFHISSRCSYKVRVV